MKTTTCKNMGGPCDAKFQGDTHDEVIKAYNAHLDDAVKAGDEAHKPEFEAMQARWKNPASGMGWYQKMQADFAGLPED